MDKNKAFLGGAVIVIIAYLIYKSSQNKSVIDAKAKADAEQRAKDLAAKSDAEKKAYQEKIKYVLERYDYYQGFEGKGQNSDVVRFRNAITQGLLSEDEFKKVEDWLKSNDKLYAGTKSDEKIKSELMEVYMKYAYGDKLMSGNLDVQYNAAGFWNK